MTDAAAGRLTARQEWRINWPLVGSALAGLSFGAIPSATLGLFMEPLQQEFGWSRAQISAGMTVVALASTPLAPFAGALVDRYGPRRVAIPGLVLSGMAFAGFGLMGGSIVHWITGWVIYALASLLIRTMVWNTAIASAFSASRGMALAVLLSGFAITQSMAPVIANWVIGSIGWRSAYLALGIGWAGLALIFVALFFRDRRESHAARQSGGPAAQPRTVPGGLTLRQAARNPQVLRIGFAMFLQSLIGAAIAVHLVPLLVAAGTTRTEAASLAALFGLASMTGKMATGWLSDRISGSLLPCTVFAMPALGYVLLLQSPGDTGLIALCVVVIGYGSGSALHMTTFLTTHYAGMRHFGKIFGLVSSGMGLAGGLGPLMAGLIFDATASYDMLLMVAAPAAILAGIAVFGLGPYPDYPPEPASSRPVGQTG